MRPTTFLLTREGSFGGRQTAMIIDNDSMHHLMGVLTNLYSDKELAVIREISTNAWDAHQAAGVVKPIEVTSPNRFNPVFIVKDYGVGLSDEDLEDIYSKYGASTKRGSNTQVGMLGLGCKAPLTYTDQFVIKSVKDGVLTYATLSKKENGAGVLEIVNQKVIDAPNGTEVQVPVRNMGTFLSKMEQFFQYWPENDVLVDGVKPKLPTNAKRISSKFVMIPGNGKDYVVMGNVAYPVDTKIGNSYRFNVIAYAEIGDIEFTPSREAIHWTDRSKTAIYKLAAEFSNASRGYAQADIDSKTSKEDAMKAAYEWCDMFGTRMTSYSYKQQSFPSRVTFTGWDVSSYGGRSRTSIVGQYLYDSLIRQKKHLLNVHNFSNSDVSSQQRKKIYTWIDESSINHRQPVIAVTDEKIDTDGWFTNVTYVDWAEVRKIKLTPSTSTRGPVNRVNHKHFNVLTSTHSYKLMEPDNTKPVYYFDQDDCSVSNEKWLFDKVLPKDSQVVSVPRRRMNSFNNKHPNALLLATSVGSYLQNSLSNIPTDIKNYVRGNSVVPRVFAELDMAKIDDKELVKDIVGSALLEKRLKEFMSQFEVGRSLGVYYSVPNYFYGRHQDIVDNKYHKRYPWVQNMTSAPASQKIDYINAMYHYKVKGN